MDDFEWVGDLAPCFSIDGSQVEVLNEPMQFYQTLQKLIGTSKRRIILSTLYLGNGELEKQLVVSLEKALASSDDDFKVVLLLDYCRGTRERDESFSGLLPLVDKYHSAGKIEVYYYHTPKLRGLLKWLLPRRWNEVIGVQHMKLYMFDDAVLISGANLSDSYFTDRQDRYVLLRGCARLTDYWADVVEAVCSCSFRLASTGALNLDKRCTVHPYEGGEQRAFCRLLKSRVDAVMHRWTGTSQAGGDVARSGDGNPATETGGDTRVYPLIQMGPIGVENDDVVTRRILSCRNPNMRMTLASGYFNLTADYSNLIAEEGRYDMEIIAAAPSANGFFEGKGLSYYVPSIYTWVLQLFYEKIHHLGLTAATAKDAAPRRNISVYEFARPDWTYHAKGLWIGSKQSLGAHPNATFVGSTNFGYRSVHQDLEAQVLLVTTNSLLQSKLAEERSRLFDYSSLVDAATFRRSDHYVPFWVRWASRFVRHFF